MTNSISKASFEYKQQTLETGLGFTMRPLDDVIASHEWHTSFLRPYTDEIHDIKLQQHQCLSVYSNNLIYLVFDYGEQRWLVGPFLNTKWCYNNYQHDVLTTLKTLKEVSPEQIKSIASLILSYLSNKHVSCSEIRMGDIEFENIRALQQNNPKKSMTVLNETFMSSLCSLLSAGKVHEMRIELQHLDAPLWKESLHQHSFRSIKNMLIGLISRFALIATQIGLDYHSTMKEADIMIHHVESLTSVDECINYLKETTVFFTQQIDQFKYEPTSKYTKYVLKRIHNSFNQALTLGALAEELNVSSSHLSRLLSQETKQSFHDLLNSERIEHAKELLRQPHLNISTVAQMCGFTYQNHFTQVFKKYTGVTPKEYIRSVSPKTTFQSI